MRTGRKRSQPVKHGCYHIPKGPVTTMNMDNTPHGSQGQQMAFVYPFIPFLSFFFSLSLFFFVSFKISEPGSSYTVWAGWPCNHTTLTSSVMGQVHTAHLLSTSFVSDRNLFQISERKTKVGRDIDYWWIIGNMTGLLATRFWIHPIWHPNCVYHRTG